jgi:hypothetical protein
MGFWTELVGVRNDLRLKSKWWHHLAIGVAVLSSFAVYLYVAGAIVRRPLKLTTDNTYSLSLLRHLRGRQQATTLSDLDSLGMVGTAARNGDLVPLARPSDGSTIQCENEAKYKVNEAVKIGRVVYRAIDDTAGQPPAELRHCIAAPAFASLAADSVKVYIPDGTGSRKQGMKGLVIGLTAVLVWLMVYWNVYYRGLMPFYARYRQNRRRRRYEAYRAR